MQQILRQFHQIITDLRWSQGRRKRLLPGKIQTLQLIDHFYNFILSCTFVIIIHFKKAKIPRLTQGDSGGPLVVKRTSKDATVVGVVSYGNGCALPSEFSVQWDAPIFTFYLFKRFLSSLFSLFQDYYGVYSDVYTFLPWIKTVLVVN